MTKTQDLENRGLTIERAGFFKDVHDPSLPANHPMNALPAWRKFLILCTLGFAGFLGNYSVATILTAFPQLGATFHRSPADIPNTIGYNLLGLAVGPLFWNPLSRTIGRRPTYILGSFLFLPCIVWMAVSTSWACFSAARFFAGLASAWTQTVPPATIADIFHPSVRGSKMSAFTVPVVIAPVVAPLICSAVVVREHPWPVLFWIVLGMAGLQFLLFVVVVPETLWNHDGSATAPARAVSSTPGQSNTISGAPAGLGDDKLDDKEGVVLAGEDSNSVDSQQSGYVGPAWMPWQRPREYLELIASPIIMVRCINITTISIYYGMIFGWSVGLTIVFPQLFAKAPYGFSEMGLGVGFLALGIGAVLGKWSGGIVGDKIVTHLAIRTYGDASARKPEFRLYGTLPMLPLLMIALSLVGASLAKEWPWPAFLVLCGVYYFAFSAITGLMQTYVSESYITKPMDAQAVFTFFKYIWGFAVPFFTFDWGLEHGWLQEYVAQGALAMGVGLILAGFYIWRGEELRRWQGMPIQVRA